MDWKTSLDRMAARTNPFLLRLAVALAVLAVLMAAPRTDQPTQTEQRQPMDLPKETPWHTD